jgi:hypothetical protein
MIDEETAESTWREVSQMGSHKARRAMEQLGRKQPALLAFVMARTSKLSADAQELAVYMFFVVYRMFEKKAEKLRRVSERDIEAALTGNEQTLERLEPAHDRFLERQAIAFQSDESFVLRYIVTTLLEPTDEDDPIELTEEEEGTILLYLKTAVDALHRAVS